MTALRSFFEALNETEVRFTKLIASDNLGLLLRCAINELDWHLYNLRLVANPSDVLLEQSYILQLGVTRLIKLSLESRTKFDVPVVTSIRKPELTIPTLDVVIALGIIQHGRRVAQTVSGGVGTVEQISQHIFEIVLPEVIFDEDYHEREVIRHFFNEHRRIFSSIEKSKAWAKTCAQVESLLNSLVYTWEDHFIGYGSDPLLDDFFFGLAYSEVMCNEGFDTFHYGVRFGGVRFQSYILALTYIISIFIKHEKFAEALTRKDPLVKLENLLTISSDTAGFVESLMEAVNYFSLAFQDAEQINLFQAKQIFSVLSCGRPDTALVDAPGAPMPYMIRCSEEGFIRSLAGIRHEPVRYLLNSLRFHYPKEYADHQQSRELSMQRAICRVLNDCIAGLKYRENLVLRFNGKVLTDVDLVVMEESTGLVTLCQLKHQELYGADLHAKRIRGERLKKEVRDWIVSVDSWLCAAGQEKIRSSLRLPKSFPKPIFRKLIVCRHYSHPLRGAISPTGAYHCSWPHFLNATLIAKRDHVYPNLEDLLHVIGCIQTELKVPTHLPEPTAKWSVGDLTFITRQGDGEHVADGK